MLGVVVLYVGVVLLSIGGVIACGFDSTEVKLREMVESLKTGGVG